MKSALILAIILLLLGCNTPQPATRLPDTAQQTPRRHTRTPQAAPSDQSFDYYLLTLSWSPEFCEAHPTARECAQHPAFVLHGLWPQNANGSYPQNCSNAPGPNNPPAYRDIYPDPGLLRHEWKTHGTCSGLSPEAFFTLARQAFHSVAIPASLTQLNQQISLPPAQIIALFQTANPTIPAASLALSCGNNRLTAIEVCMDKNAQPTACSHIRSCRANVVRITPP
jgi:ribonuclease T2